MKTEEFLGKKKNNRGQFAIEAVLLMTILVGCFIAVTNYARSNQVLNTLFETPFKSLKIMAGYGVWKTDPSFGCKAPGTSSAPMTLGKCHPNSIARALSSNPKE